VRELLQSIIATTPVTTDKNLLESVLEALKQHPSVQPHAVML
jgi:hypothetical protein